jgi:hypothetical protein
MSSQASSRLHRLVVLGLLAVLVGGCQSKSREPRRLPFPTFRAEALFAEYRSMQGPPENRAGSTSTQFARDLSQGLGGEATSEPQGQSVPLGSAMTGEIPNQEGWTWSIEDGATLIVYAPGAGRPGAMVYAEPFSPEIHDHPSAEFLRFQLTVDPDLAESYLKLSGVGILLKTRTLGRGLGFRPTRGTFTGWRWVGRNERGVTLRCGRHLGVWSEPRPLPAPLAQALRQRGSEPQNLEPSSTAATPGVSASLILGSATDRDEETGVHLAVLCVREPRCLVYKDLAHFLASIQIAEGSLVERLRSAPPIAFQDVVQQSGLALVEKSALADVSRLTGACDCSADLYDCPDFQTHDEAQACLQHCEDSGRGDVHRLDQDKDGDACECDPRIKGRCMRDW